ncbi:MAG: glutaredoxin [Gammaproteobacteria bacterium]|jgi:glutaredoxin
MKQLMIFAALIGGIYFFNPGIIYRFLPVDTIEANDEVVVFTYRGCGAPCDNVIHLLQKKNTPFESHDIRASEVSAAKFDDMGGGDNFPVIHIGSKKIVGFHRTPLLHDLAKAYGIDVFDRAQRAAVLTHFNRGGNGELVMYGASWCPYCKKAQDFFTANEIDYHEVDVEKSAQAQRNYLALEGRGYPLIYVGANRFEGFGGRIPTDILRLF